VLRDLKKIYPEERLKNSNLRVRKYNSEVEHLPNIHKSLGLKNKQKNSKLSGCSARGVTNGDKRLVMTQNTAK
jgi:hypothetical protein